MKKEIYTTYAPNTDITFIMCDTYKGEDVVSTSVVGWYHGEPDDELTKAFNGSLTANYFVG
jgi:hypothetical protein